jgi:hypothetical protein
MQLSVKCYAYKTSFVWQTHFGKEAVGEIEPLRLLAYLYNSLPVISAFWHQD